MRYFIVFIATLLVSAGVYAQAEDIPLKDFDSVLIDQAEHVLGQIKVGMEEVLFYKFDGVPYIEGFPFLVLWLIIGAVFFTLRLGFINIRMFCHALKVVTGKYDNEEDPGEITHFQALSAAVSATVGLGNIAGVAVAVTAGGPGAVIWMVLAGFLGMSLKFSEVTLGHKYRKFSKKGRVSGGAFYYLRDGLAEIGLPGLGKVLAVIFAFSCLAGSLGGGNMFQANQAVSILKDTFTFLKPVDWLLAATFAVSVGAILLGGIRRIAKVAEKIVPLMAVIYIVACVVIIVTHAGAIPEAFWTMVSSAFSGEAAAGGILGAVIAGFKRAAFSSESGVGSAPIAHAAAKTTEPVREGCVALLEPFLDTIVICFLTGIVLTVTGVYAEDGVGKGVLMTSAAFASVIDWFPMVLSLAVVLFAFSTMITWSYYGERAWNYLFNGKGVNVYHIIFATCTFFGGIVKLDLVVDISDMLLLFMAVPNLLGLYLLSGVLMREVNAYTAKVKSGEFDKMAEKST